MYTSFTCPPRTPMADSVVHWKKANVIHMGDLYFPRAVSLRRCRPRRVAPAASSKPATACSRSPTNKTKIVPGHGRLSNKKELKTYRDMIAGVISKVDAMLAKGMSVDDVVKAKPTKDLDEQWDFGSTTPDKWTRLIARSVEADRKKKSPSAAKSQEQKGERQGQVSKLAAQSCQRIIGRAELPGSSVAQSDHRQSPRSRRTT